MASYGEASGLTVLSQIIRILGRDDVSEADRVQALYERLFEAPAGREFELRPFDGWEIFELQQAVDMVVDIVARYTYHYADARVIPVTYYKRERRTRRHLDAQFSALFKELIRRTGRVAEATLVTQEPIYFLEQRVRQKTFPRPRDGKTFLQLLRTRLHLELSRYLGTGGEGRRVLLPYEIR